MKKDEKKKKRSLKQNKNNKKIVFIFVRYLILITLSISLPVFYRILTPLTIYSTAGILKIFYSVSIFGDIISISGVLIQIISACVAGSAYLLLLIINLTISMNKKQRVYSILFSLGLLFIVNILRIVFLAILLVQGFNFFDFIHKLFWYLLSTVFVIIIWFLTAYLFKIKKIPVYSDLMGFIRTIKNPS